MSNIPTYLAANKSRNENHPSINDGSVYRPIIIRMAAIKGATSLVQDPSKTTRTSGGLLRSSKRALRSSKFEALSKKKGEVQAPCTEATDSISLHCFKSACRDTTTLLPIPIESPSLSQENSRSSRSWYEVINQSPREFPSFLPSPDTLPWIHTHIYTYVHIYSKHRRLNLANRFRLDRALFFRRELHWLRRTLITIREDCSNSTSLVPIPDSWPPTLLACCAHREKGLLEGALVPSYFFSSRPPILPRWRNVPQKIAPPGNSVRARARGGNLLRSAFDALFKPYLFPFSPPVQRSNSRGGRDFISAGVSSRFECLRDTFIVPFICDPDSRKSRKRIEGTKWENERSSLTSDLIYWNVMRIRVSTIWKSNHVWRLSTP